MARHSYLPIGDQSGGTLDPGPYPDLLRVRLLTPDGSDTRSRHIAGNIIRPGGPRLGLLRVSIFVISPFA